MKFQKNTIYVCDSCGLGQYHPLVYCRRCPGRYVKREIQEPLRPYDETRAYLKQHYGIEHLGEFPKFDKPDQPKEKLP